MSKIQQATEPKSICLCGHTGDGPNSAHGGLIGHGPCLVDDCACRKFTWASFTLYGQEMMDRARKLRPKK